MLANLHFKKRDEHRLGLIDVNTHIDNFLLEGSSTFARILSERLMAWHELLDIDVEDKGKEDSFTPAQNQMAEIECWRCFKIAWES